jgi:hypothetical protein
MEHQLNRSERIVSEVEYLAGRRQLVQASNLAEQGKKNCRLREVLSLYGVGESYF